VAWNVEDGVAPAVQAERTPSLDGRGDVGARTDREPAIIGWRRLARTVASVAEREGGEGAAADQPHRLRYKPLTRN